RRAAPGGFERSPLRPAPTAGEGRKRSDTCGRCFRLPRSRASPKSGPHSMLCSSWLRLLDHRPEGHLPPCAVHEREGSSYPFSSPQAEPHSTRFVGLRRSLVSGLLITLAGFATEDNIWAEFDQQWRAILGDNSRRPKATYLHMKEAV